MLPDQDTAKKKFPFRRFVAVLLLIGAAGAVYAASTRPSGSKGDILGEQAVLLVSPPPRQTTPVPQTDLKTALSDLLQGPGQELRQTAVDTASQVRESVVTTVIHTVTSQIDKLAPQDKEKVKESICR